jgi:hypothetical protein
MKISWPGKKVKQVPVGEQKLGNMAACTSKICDISWINYIIENDAFDLPNIPTCKSFIREF